MSMFVLLVRLMLRFTFVSLPKPLDASTSSFSSESQSFATKVRDFALQNYPSLFPDDLPPELPPANRIHHPIDLVPST